SLWLEWANNLVDLPKGLPSLFRDDRTRLWLKIVVWVASMLAAWLAMVIVDSRDSRRDPFEAGNAVGSSVRLSVQSTWCVAIALTVAWRVDGAQPLTPKTAELNLLRHASPWRSAAYNFGAVRFESSEQLFSTLRIETDRQRRPATSPTIFSARDVPAGAYGVH